MNNIMTQEDKDLLLEDICSRLPYGVKCNVGEETPYTLSGIEIDDANGHLFDFVEKKNGLNMQVYLSEVKPYLFPLNNLTEEQRNEISKLIIDTQYEFSPYGKINMFGCDNLFISTVKQSNALIKYCIINHFDINGLIDKGLALNATGLNIY
jgi:hypothetical protein